MREAWEEPLLNWGEMKTTATASTAFSSLPVGPFRPPPSRCEAVSRGRSLTYELVQATGFHLGVIVPLILISSVWHSKRYRNKPKVTEGNAQTQLKCGAFPEVLWEVLFRK